MPNLPAAKVAGSNNDAEFFNTETLLPADDDHGNTKLGKLEAPNLTHSMFLHINVFFFAWARLLVNIRNRSVGHIQPYPACPIIANKGASALKSKQLVSQQQLQKKDVSKGMHAQSFSKNGGGSTILWH